MTRAIKKFSKSIIPYKLFSFSSRTFFMFYEKHKKGENSFENFKHKDAGEHIASDINKTCENLSHKELYLVVKFMEMRMFGI